MIIPMRSSINEVVCLFILHRVTHFFYNRIILTRTVTSSTTTFPDRPVNIYFYWYSYTVIIDSMTFKLRRHYLISRCFAKMGSRWQAILQAIVMVLFIEPLSRNQPQNDDQLSTKESSLWNRKGFTVSSKVCLCFLTSTSTDILINSIFSAHMCIFNAARVCNAYYYH